MEVSSVPDLVSLADIRAAQERLTGIAVRTPLVPCLWTPAGAGALYLKPEMLQPIGAFKLRGAYNMIATLTPSEREHGLVASSSGNHAQAVAYVARMFGARATIVITDTASEHKVAATKALGADVVLVPPHERDVVPQQLIEEHGYVHIPPYDDPAIIAGQGTIGAEIADDLPDADLVLTPISGGGLTAGVATAVKALRPSARVVAVEPELAGDATESFRRGERVAWTSEQTQRTIADGLRTMSVGMHPWEHIRTYVDDIITVTEDEIRAAMRTLAVNARLVAEPSAAVATAGYLFARERLPAANHTVAVLSGGNVDPALLATILTA